MGITSIRRDTSALPAIVRVLTTDNLATITTSGYLTNQESVIESLNSGPFEWKDNDLIAIGYDGGEGFFQRDTTNNTFFIVPLPSLTNSYIFVGNASNIATGVAMSGDIAIDNTGDTTIQTGAVLLSNLATGIAPSHVAKFGGSHTTTGGNVTEAITVTGALATDLVMATLADRGTNTVLLYVAFASSDTVTFTFSADPGNDAVVNYTVFRAAT